MALTPGAVKPPGGKSPLHTAGFVPGETGAVPGLQDACPLTTQGGGSKRKAAAGEHGKARASPRMRAEQEDGGGYRVPVPQATQHSFSVMHGLTL